VYESLCSVVFLHQIYIFQESIMNDFLFRGSLVDLDPELKQLAELEAERQYRKLILIPSESTAPEAVREALSTTFQNIYAEGYPDEETRWMEEAEILDYEARLSHYRRYSDPRYYKGVEYADIVEALARRRCAELFAANGVSADQIYVNVQPLSGAPANNGIYTALIEPGDVIMGMDLLHGGHLSHGSPANRTGKLYKAISYNVDAETEQIDYEAVEALALEHCPKILIAGYSSYPWAVDWARFRAIADKAGAILMADIAHVAGLVAAGVYPSPVGFADVISFTTHKSLCGPRGACVLTTNPILARKIDRGIFPGEQGGPHVQVFLAMAVAFKLDRTDEFRKLGQQIVKNCAAFTSRLQERGFRIPFGGTNTHLMNLDCTTITGPDGTRLSGDMAARILDLAGIVVNRNTIPGDRSAANPSGVRMGTPWITQRGFKEAEILQLADIIADLLQATIPYSSPGRRGQVARAKVDFSVLEDCKLRVRSLAEAAGIDYTPTRHGYPHFYFKDDAPRYAGEQAALELEGESILPFLNYAFTSDVEALQPGQSQATRLVMPVAEVDGVLTRVDEDKYSLVFPVGQYGLVSTWLRSLSDGFVAFDHDPYRKLPGPVLVRETKLSETSLSVEESPLWVQKPYSICMPVVEGQPLPAFSWEENPAGSELRRTPVFEVHQSLGAKIIPFAGWEMPVWYSSVVDEHLAVRKAAGLFDVAHMGVYQAEGPDAAVFLDSVCGNDIANLGVGESLYTHFLDPNANVIDDLLVYRRRIDQYLVVVNASNDDKDWAWLNAVKDGQVLVDKDRPWARAFGRNVTLRNLRDPKEGADMRVDIALQGPRSRDILFALGVEDEDRRRIMALKRTQLCEAVVGGFDLVVSRTGYTGEKMAFELFVHPDQAAALFSQLIKAGQPYGIKPCGLGARDSLRTEAGLPLYGHEMGGDFNLGVAEAGFGSYVKTYKPWFIGRSAFMAAESRRKGVVARFRFNEKGVRMAHLGDPVLDKRGRVVGKVSSCAVDSEGFLTGQAFLELKLAEPDSALFIYQSAPKSAGKAPAELTIGDRSTLPSTASVLTRFPK
jgi:glycine hydroxymethyltransferase